MIQLTNDPLENKNYNPKFKLILVKLNILIQGKLSLYLQAKGKEKTEIYKLLLITVLFLYIIIYNLKSPEKVILFFKLNNSAILKLLKGMLNVFKDDDAKINRNYLKLSHFIMNLCFDDIKNKVLSSKNEELIEFYQTEIYFELINIFPTSHKRIENKEKYNIFIKNIIQLNWDNYIYNLKGEKSEIFCRNLIPILISEKGFDFIDFFNFVVKKHIEIIRKEYNNELTSLFRADDFTNDLIKNLIIIFGNDSFIHSFYFTLPKEYLSNNEIIFELNSFENFLHKFLEKLNETLPFIIRILLKIVYNQVQNLNKTEDNYNVLYTVLIFNFFISPSILELFNISMVKFKSLRQLTRILRNIFFGKEFDNNDKLSYFNQKVQIFHKYINEQFKNLLEGIEIEKDKEDINKKINNILINAKDIKDPMIINDGVLLPSFCYLFFWANIQYSEKDITQVK